MLGPEYDAEARFRQGLDSLATWQLVSAHPGQGCCRHDYLEPSAGEGLRSAANFTNNLGDQMAIPDNSCRRQSSGMRKPGTVRSHLELGRNGSRKLAIVLLQLAARDTLTLSLSTSRNTAQPCGLNKSVALSLEVPSHHDHV